MEYQWIELLGWALSCGMPLSNDQEKINFFNALREQIQARNLKMAECMVEFHWVLYTVAPWLADDFIRIYTPTKKGES